MVFDGVDGADVADGADAVVCVGDAEPDDGEITRTRKVRRSFVAEKYDDLVTALYKGDNEVSTKTEVTYEDGKNGYLEATLALVDAQTYMLKEKSDAA